MKRSVDFRVTPAQRHKDHARAEMALGKPLKGHPVHHHSPTQLVICEDTAYHALLHKRQYDYRFEHEPEFAQREIAAIEAMADEADAESELLITVLLRFGTPELTQQALISRERIRVRRDEALLRRHNARALRT